MKEVPAIVVHQEIKPKTTSKNIQVIKTKVNRTQTLTNLREESRKNAIIVDFTDSNYDRNQDDPDQCDGES